MALVEYDATGHVAVIRLNRPERLNATSPDLRAELVTAFRRFIDDDGARVGILTGTGRAFCAGRDLKAQAEGTLILSGKAEYSAERNMFGVADTDKPLIAAVNGFAIGAGWYMVAGCDIRVATEEAEFSMAELPTGVLGPYWLAACEMVPWAVAAEIALG